MFKIQYINKLFTIFIFVHLIVWVLVPTLTNKNLPLDTIEALAWSSDLDWGYYKHPPASAFFVEVIYQIFKSNDWAYYLLSQIFVVASFLLVWQFSKIFFKKDIFSLLSVVCLEAFIFYNYTTPEFNVYISQMPFRVLSILFFWKAYETKKVFYFILFGIFSSIAFLSHYLFIYLLLSLKIFVLMDLKKNLEKIKLYFLSSLVFFIIISPHIIWLFENNFSTFTYALQRTGAGNYDIFNHIKHPILFIFKQLGLLIPFIILISSIIKKFFLRINIKDKKLIFLLTINFAPIILMLITSIFFGTRIRTMWLSPFYLTFGVLVFYIYKNNLNLKKLRRFTIIFLILSISYPIAYTLVSILNDKKRTDYPGEEIADLVQRRWDRNFSNEIKYVIGDEWSAGNLSYHLASRPIWKNELKNFKDKINENSGIIYTGNPEILKKICPGEYGTIKPVGYCMIGRR